MIRWHGKSYTIAEADGLAIKEHRAGNFQAVANIYGLILAQAPNYAEGHNNRGAALQKLQRYSDALASYDRAIALKPNYANAHYNRGSNLKKMNRPDDALASYEQAIALNPNHAEAHNNRGVTLQEMKRYAEALPSYERAIALNPAYTEAYYNLGTLLVSKGDMAAAEDHQNRFSALRKELYALGFPPAMVKRALCLAIPEVGHSRAPVLISDDVNTKVKEISKKYAELIS